MRILFEIILAIVSLFLGWVFGKFWPDSSDFDAYKKGRAYDATWKK